jgi:outer membrane protein assembly factor BamB
MITEGIWIRESGIGAGRLEGETRKEDVDARRGSAGGSPLVCNGLVYLSRNNEALTCLDAATGETIYKVKPDKESHSASPVAGDGKVYFAGLGGRVSAVGPGCTYNPLDANWLGESIDSSSAIRGGRRSLRGAAQLWAIGAR